MVISVVGKSGSGKTTIANIFESLDERIIHIDVDKIAHQVLTYPEVKEKIKKSFSNECVVSDQVQRKVLGQIVFSSSDKMQILTEITWPPMEAIIDQILIDNPDKIIILDWLLLPKTKFFNQSDLRIWVNSSTKERLERVLKRSSPTENISREYFLKRDSADIDYEEEKYDVVINNTNANNIFEEVKKLYEKSIISR